MSQVKATFSGGVVAEPEDFTFTSGASVRTIPVYVNHQRKNKDSNEYEDTGDTTKIRVRLFGDNATFDVRKGDIVEVIGTIVEKEFDKRDGTKGRQIETDWVESIRLVYRKDGASAAAPAATGFNSPVPAGF